jgi:serine/threonine protein kinase
MSLCINPHCSQPNNIEQQQAIDWLKELVGILGQVHQQDFFHRDIKPSNIMIRSSNWHRSQSTGWRDGHCFSWLYTTRAEQ